MKLRTLGFLILAVLPSCSDGGTDPPEDLCVIQALLLSGDPDGPTIIDVELEIQSTGVLGQAVRED